MGKFIDCTEWKNKQVVIRNQMISRLYKACDALNGGDREELSTLLQFIHNVYKNGYTVNMESDYNFQLFHETYTKSDYMIIVEEDGKPLIAIVKLKSGQCNGEWRTYEIDPHDFMYDEDIRAEAQAEQDAENAYERHLDYKASFDDPRGQ